MLMNLLIIIHKKYSQFEPSRNMNKSIFLLIRVIWCFFFEITRLVIEYDLHATIY